MMFDDLLLSNAHLVEEMYKKYIENPESLDSTWKTYFDRIDGESVVRQHVTDTTATDVLRISNLINAYRTYGHLYAKVDPLSSHETKEPWQLNLRTLGFSKSDLLTVYPTCGLLEQSSAPLDRIISTLKSIYCDKIGFEYMGLEALEMEKWIQEKIETHQGDHPLTIDQKKLILQYLNQSELLEVFIHTKYTGQKRFSLEGGETLIPVLASIIEFGASLGSIEYVIGMAHRGRLNVLCNIMKKSYKDIFSEFEEGYIPMSFEGSGDVKYHKGFSSKIMTSAGKEVQVDLLPNPSHLEAVVPVVEGYVKAMQIKHGDIEKNQIIPILVHGDAAVAGQGVVYETLQMYKLDGYATGGSIHIVINNQIGFTTLPKDGRSTRYCTDIAKSFSAPVFHVNAEDPEGCVRAINMAVEIKNRFKCDVFLDLICYRKYGHNETDEPAYTQPAEYSEIRKKRPIREIYRDHLIMQGILERQIAESLEAEFKETLQKDLEKAKVPFTGSVEISGSVEDLHSEKFNYFDKIDTAVNEGVLREIAEKVSTIPPGFTINNKLKKIIDERRNMVLENHPIDWGMGETLAYGTLLWEGRHVRLSGQDCCRGTFSHRHAMWMDQVVYEPYFPLQHLKEGQGRFDVYNSPLSEYAVMGFEFGYNLARCDALVIWEAQFGDFCNGSQIVIDQFISTCEQKWGQKQSLVLFLPHGYEGQGPEHSSGRMERFLTLCGDSNLFVVYPTTPAQLFHLLRRQVMRPLKKPMIVFTPKGLLRHPRCTSKLGDLSNGGFEEIIDDPTEIANPERVVLCSGRIYYDLIDAREKYKNSNTVIIRIEQLYPLNEERLNDLMAKYMGFNECIWVQEEPSNMGAWNYMQPHLHKMILRGSCIKYIGRTRSASPAAGSYTLHKKQHKDIIEALFENKQNAAVEVYTEQDLIC